MWGCTRTALKKGNTLVHMYCNTLWSVCQCEDAVVTLDDILTFCEDVREQSDGSYMALCPCHDDHTPSLHITPKDKDIYLYCFAGCLQSKLLKYFGFSNNDSRHLAIDWINKALNSPWPGRSGPIDRVVYIAMCEMMYKVGRPFVGMDQRTMAETVNISNGSASNSLRRLGRPIDKTTGEVLPALVADLHHKDDTFGTKHYRVCQYLIIHIHVLNDKVLTDVPVYVHAMNDKVLTDTFTSYLNHDLFIRGGLGKGGAQLWHFLQSPISTEHLAAKSGRAINTVKHSLALMEELHLVTKAEDLWMRAPDANLDLAAKSLGVWGRLKRRKKEHEEQRKYQAAYREDKAKQKREKVAENIEYQCEQESLGFTFRKQLVTA